MFVEAHRREEPMLWLEFGVYRGTSVNLTDASRAVRKSNSRRRHLFDGVYGQCARLTGPFLIRLRAAGNFQARVVGFDTFQGLPDCVTTLRDQLTNQLLLELVFLFGWRCCC